MAANTVGVTDNHEGRAPARKVGRFVAIAALVILIASTIAGAIIPTGLEVPEPDPGIGELLHILRSNLTILLALGFCAGLQRFARQEVEDGSKPWVRWICDTIIGAFIILNVTAIGFAIGQLGGDALIRILPHAWLEVPAFGLGIWGYALARSDALSRAEGIRIFGAAAVLLLLAAPTEVFISGGIQ